MTNIGNTVLKSPVMIAAGNFGYDGFGMSQNHHPLHSLGGVVMKTLTRYRTIGNIEPRQFPERFAEGLKTGQPLLNSYGLNNPGIDFAANYLFEEWAKLDTGIIVSIFADNKKDLKYIARIIGNTSVFSAIEVNISCPNLGYDADDIELSYRQIDAIVTTVKECTSLPVWVKLPPNIDNIIDIAEEALDAGADALTIANTIPALHIDIKTGRSLLGNVYGGMSGPALKPINMLLVHKVTQWVDIPVIGVGGINSGADVMEYTLAGASAVQIGSASHADLDAPFRILYEYNALRYDVDN